MTGAELRVCWGKNIMDLSEEELSRALDEVQSRGMEVVSIASPLLKCVLPNSDSGISTATLAARVRMP